MDINLVYDEELGKYFVYHGLDFVHETTEMDSAIDAFKEIVEGVNSKT